MLEKIYRDLIKIEIEIIKLSPYYNPSVVEKIQSLHGNSTNKMYLYDLEKYREELDILEDKKSIVDIDKSDLNILIDWEKLENERSVSF